MKLILSLTMLVFLSACATNQNKVESLKDVKVETKGVVSDTTVIGLNSNKEAVIQSTETVQRELNGIVWWNNTKQQELNHEYAELKRCRRDLSDPRLGGAGFVKVPELRKKWDAKSTEKMGLLGDDLVVVKEEYLKERIAVEKDKSQYLDEMIDTVKESREECEWTMGQARVKAGLPSKRYQGQITVTPDGKVGRVLERHEHTLDDAFEIQAEKGEAKVQLKEDRDHNKQIELEKAKRPVIKGGSRGDTPWYNRFFNN